MINWTDASSIRQALADKLADRKAAQSSLQQAQHELIQADEHLDDAAAAQTIIQDVAQAVQQEAHSKISGVVSRCLEYVFDFPYEFEVMFEQKRGRTEASFRFLRDGLDVDPVKSCGGGPIDVAAFALRLACLMLSRPPLRRVLILDEPFRYVSVEYRDRVRTLLETLSVEMGVQIIQVTHSEELMAGKIVRLGRQKSG